MVRHPRSTAFAAAVGVTFVFAAGCGARSSLFEGSFERGDDGGEDAGDHPDAGRPDAGQPDAGQPDAGTCGPGCGAQNTVFYDGFESGTGDWLLDALWSESSNAATGNAALRGYWQDFDVGCNVTDSARLAVDVNLANATAATLTFAQTGEACEFDSLRVLVSTDGGASWSPAATPPAPTSTWTRACIDLGPWLGLPTVRFGFEFTNVCGDPCGVDWSVDDVTVCASR